MPGALAAADHGKTSDCPGITVLMPLALFGILGHCVVLVHEFTEVVIANGVRADLSKPLAGHLDT